MIVVPFGEDDWAAFAGVDGPNPYMCHPTAPETHPREKRFWIVLDGNYAEAYIGEDCVLYFSALFPDFGTAMGAVLDLTGAEGLEAVKKIVLRWGCRALLDKYTKSIADDPSTPLST